MAALKTPIGHCHTEEWETLQNKLRDESCLRLNYEGTLIFSQQDNPEGGGLILLSIARLNEFTDDLAKMGIEVDTDVIVPYACDWYNGADSHMSDLTFEEFCDRTAEDRQLLGSSPA